jgi:hypothetical protein
MVPASDRVCLLGQLCKTLLRIFTVGFISMCFAEMAYEFNNIDGTHTMVKGSVRILII